MLQSRSKVELVVALWSNETGRNSNHDPILIRELKEKLNIVKGLNILEVLRERHTEGGEPEEWLLKKRLL